MRLLFTLASGKLTGVAYPTIQLLIELEKKGIYTTLLCYRGSLMKEALNEGLSVKRFTIRNLTLEGRRASHIFTSRSKDHALVALLFAYKRPIYRLWYKREPPHGLWANCLKSVTKRYFSPYPLPMMKDVAFLPGAVDITRFSPRWEKRKAKSLLDVDGLVVGMVARMKKGRGQVELLEAASRCHLSFYLLFLGGGEGVRDVLDMSKRLGLKDKVKIVVDKGQDLPSLLESIDVLPYLSLGSEATGRTVLEAMAMGLPVLAVPEGGIPFLLGEWNSPFTDSKRGDLHIFLQELLANPWVRRKMGRLNLSRARRFDPSRRADSLLAGIAA